MSFDWREYLDLARELAASGAGAPQAEARWRSAISRAYYAAYAECRAFIIEKMQYDPHDPVARGRAHEAVVRKFERSPSLGRQRIGVQLRRLMAQRLVADYEATAVISGGLASGAVERAETILAALEVV